MGKNIIICCDGTGNEYGKIIQMLSICIPQLFVTSQMAYYDPGVGTFSIFGRTIGKKVGIILGNAFGYGLQANIEDAYEYLMNRYEPGGQIISIRFQPWCSSRYAL